MINDEHASSHHALFKLATALVRPGPRLHRGTWLNNRRVFQAQRLKKGDKIKIGRTIVAVVSA